MKKRKILAMLMVAALSAGMLAGCGSDDTKEASSETLSEDQQRKQKNSDQSDKKE